jgi:DNA-binding MarR family transcriptional regulator
MGYTLEALVQEHAPVKGGAFKVLFFLASSTKEGFYTCWHSHSSIAKNTKVSIRQVIRAIKKLEDMGTIEVHRTLGGGIRNLYVVLTPEPRAKVKRKNKYIREKEAHNEIIKEINAKRQEENNRADGDIKKMKKLERFRNLDHLEKMNRFSPKNEEGKNPKKLELLRNQDHAKKRE